MARLEIAPMPQLHWLTWRGELQESPAGFGLAHRTRNAHMVRELTAVSNFPGRAEMGTWRHGGIFPTGWIISCGWLPDLATTSHAYGYVRKIQMDCELWDFRLVIQSCLDIRPWAAFTWRSNSSFPSGRWSFFIMQQTSCPGCKQWVRNWYEQFPVLHI